MHPLYILLFLLFISNERWLGVCDTEWKRNWNCNERRFFFSFSLTNKQNYRCTQPQTCIKLVMRNLGRLSRMRMLFFNYFFLNSQKYLGKKKKNCRIGIEKKCWQLCEFCLKVAIHPLHKKYKMIKPVNKIFKEPTRNTAFIKVWLVWHWPRRQN